MGGESIWNRGEDWTFPRLRGPHRRDVAVVGGGLTGLTVALWLSRAGLRVTLLEGETLGCGASGRCAGILSPIHRRMIQSLEERMGNTAATVYLRAQTTAFAAIRSLAEAGRFNWQDADVRLVASASMEQEAAVLRRCAIPAQAIAGAHSPFSGNHALILRNMATLDAGLYLSWLIEKAYLTGVEIYEHSRVVGLETNMAQTQEGSVTAPYIVVATGYPVVNVPGWYFLRLTQRRRWLTALEGSPVGEGVYLDARGRYELRKWNRSSLLTVDGGPVGCRPAQKPGNLRVADGLGEVNPDHIREGVETFSADGLPYIGAYSRKTPNLFVATGYGGNGLLGSMVAAQLISARILGLPAEAAYLFSGQRSGADVVAREAGTALGIAARYAGSFLHLRSPRCPHMGCKLRYSPSRHLWECPCHGSRFDDIGHLLNAPAVEDADIRRR